MKVLEINSVCNGSTGKIACDLARKLIKDGHECKIAYGRGNPPKEIPSIKIGSRASVFFHGLKARLFDKSGFGSAFATKKLIKEIEIFNPDIIHLHNIHGYYIDVKLLFNYLKQSKKKLYGHCMTAGLLLAIAAILIMRNAINGKLSVQNASLRTIIQNH